MAELDILSRPLMPVGGDIGSDYKVTLYMHEGYDYMMHSVEGCVEALRDKPADGMWWKVIGDLKNPYFEWPVYARKTSNDVAGKERLKIRTQWRKEQGP